MEKQGVMLMKTLELAVGMLDSMDELVPVLQSLGRRHVSYGVKARMYPSVGDALLITLEKGLGGEYTGMTKEAWGWVLGVISGVCIEAAKGIDPEYGEVEPEREEGDKVEEPKTGEAGRGGEGGKVEEPQANEVDKGRGGGDRGAGAGEGEESKDVKGEKAKVEGEGVSSRGSTVEESATDGNTTDESTTDERTAKETTTTIEETSEKKSDESTATTVESAATSRESSAPDAVEIVAKTTITTTESAATATEESSTKDEKRDEGDDAKAVNDGGEEGENDPELKLALKLKEVDLAKIEEVKREPIQVALSLSEKMAEME
eukprot:jgi/Undpi1/10990/HiC_scaffold_30.g13291.m1